MNQRTYNGVTGVFCAVVAVMHAVRVVRNWPVVISSQVIPLWLSILPVIFCGYLAYVAFRLVMKHEVKS